MQYDDRSNNRYFRRSEHSGDNGYDGESSMRSQRESKDRGAEYGRRGEYNRSAGDERRSGYERRNDYSRNTRDDRGYGYERRSDYSRSTGYDRNSEYERRSSYNRSSGYDSRSYSRGSQNGGNYGHRRSYGRRRENQRKLMIYRAAALLALVLLVIGVSQMFLYFNGVFAIGNKAARSMLKNESAVNASAKEKDRGGFSLYFDGIECIVDIGKNKLFSAFSHVKPCVSVEAGSESVSVEDFVTKDADECTLDIADAEVDFSHTGYYNVTVYKGKKKYERLLFVVDTVAPSAEAVEYTAGCGEDIEPDKLVANVSDVTDVTIKFEKKPDVSKPDTLTVSVCVTDEGGNTTVVKSKLTVSNDTEPPVISGAADASYHIGETIMYKEGITVTDNLDSDPKLEVDSSAVIPTELGSYPVTYKATDASGNESSVTVTFTILEKSEGQKLEETMNEMVNDILADIVSDSMTKREKAKAIYDWTKWSIAYTGHADKDGYVKAAVTGLKTRGGDCYTYFAVSKAMLNAVGIENIDVEKIEKPGRSRHYWSLINCGDGWYHFDATPRRTGGDFFMLTDAEILEYSAAHDDSHDFDRSLYPATP